MTAQMQSRHSMVFKHSFGFKPGLRLGPGHPGHTDVGEYSSLPCHVQSGIMGPRSPGVTDTDLNFDSLKSEGEHRRAGEQHRSFIFQPKSGNTKMFVLPFV